MILILLFTRLIVVGLGCMSLIGWPSLTYPQNLPYAPTPNNPVGRAPQGLTAGDFNRDGHVDIATVNSTSDDVSVLLGNGNGTFQSAISFGIGKLPLALVADDMDRDGLVDLVVALSGFDQVVVSKGDGKGGFQKLTSHPMGKGTTFLAVRDLNGDQWNDLVAVNSGRFGYYPPFSLAVVLTDEMGHRDKPVLYEQDRGKDIFPTGVFVGDLTGDDVVDLAVTWSQPSWSSANGFISILKNEGDGTFSHVKDVAAGFTLSAIQGADIDRNGLVDLAVTSLYFDTVRILLQESPGEFRLLEPIKVGFAPVGVEIHDFNQDGELDLVVVNRDSDSLSLFLGDGKGDFRTVGHFGVGATPAAVVVKDFDQDSRPDFATASTNVDAVSVLLSGGGAIPLPSMTADSLVFEPDLDLESAHLLSQQAIRFTNIGLGPLRIDDIAISGAGADAFVMVHDTCYGITLHAGESCSLKVAFTAKDSGTHYATLIVQDNASGSPRRVTLKGVSKG